MTPDEEKISKIDAITDPMEALRVLSDNWEYLGGDPCYWRIEQALSAMVDRVLGVERRV